VRIVAGKHRGRTLEAPPGLATRPTSDRARQALFNIVENGKFASRGSVFIGHPVLDIFAGTGALGLEALSRGAAKAIFVEQDKAALTALTANIRALRETDACEILRSDARTPSPCRGEPARLVLLDPPYGQDLGAPALSAFARAGWLAPEALVILEVARDEPFAAPAGAARLVFLKQA
jgi:16S rRNA (guanine966-N2)-methyltransferase